MPTVVYTTILHQPIETVWAALTDFESMPQWQHEVIREWQTPPGPLTVGDQIHQIRMFRGRRIESTSQVKDYEPGRMLVAASDPAVSPWVRTAYYCAPVEDGTQLTFSIERRGTGLFHLLSPLIQRALTRDVVTRFARLEAYLAHGSHHRRRRGRRARYRVGRAEEEAAMARLARVLVTEARAQPARNRRSAGARGHPMVPWGKAPRPVVGSGLPETHQRRDP